MALQSVKGTWLGIPDFGITEYARSLMGKTQSAERKTTFNNPAVVQAVGGSFTPQRVSSMTYPQQTNTGVLGTNTTTNRSTGSGTPSYSQTPTNQINPADTSMVDNGLQAGNDQIESDYQNALMMADTAESGLRSQAGQATSELNTQGLETSNALESQRVSGEAGVRTQEQSAQKTAGTSMQQARDLFRQTQQQNIAQLSALGLSSSSVMEGLAEKLGVETAKRIGGITGSLDEVMTNLGQERARVNDYAKTKTVELQQQLQNQLSSIQNQLLQGIKQISDSRQLAATAKANARAELLSQAQNQIYEIQSNANQFAQQMQQWAQQKSTTLADASKALQAGTINTGGLNAAGQAVSNIGNQVLSSPVQSSSIPAGYKYINGKLVKDENAIINPF